MWNDSIPRVRVLRYKHDIGTSGRPIKILNAWRLANALYLDLSRENNVIQARLSHVAGRGVSQISLHILYALFKLKFYVKLGLEEGHVSRNISLSTGVRFVGFTLE